MNYEAALSNLKSLQFRKAATKIESEVMKVMRKRFINVVAIKVTTFSSDNNTLVVNLIVVMDKNFAGDGNTISQIANEIANGNYTTLVIDRNFDVTVRG